MNKIIFLFLLSLAQVSFSGISGLGGGPSSSTNSTKNTDDAAVLGTVSVCNYDDELICRRLAIKKLQLSAPAVIYELCYQEHTLMPVNCPVISNTGLLKLLRSISQAFDEAGFTPQSEEIRYNGN